MRVAPHLDEGAHGEREGELLPLRHHAHPARERRARPLGDRAAGEGRRTGPGAQRSDAPPPDAGEALWLTYYRHIFNPARLKLSMMKKEMPTRYWHNLPEAALITELAQTAHERSAKMVEAEATVPRRRIAGKETRA